MKLIPVEIEMLLNIFMNKNKYLIMKRIILILFIGFLTFSCSDENDPIEETEKKLKNIIEHDLGFGGVSYRTIYSLENNKYIESIDYKTQVGVERMQSRKEYFYNNNGLIESMLEYNQENTLYKEHFYYYDSEGRISERILNFPDGFNRITNTYIYNSDNTIKVIRESKFADWEVIYYLNDNGAIYNIESSVIGLMFEAEYEGNNIVELKYGNDLYNFSFKDENLFMVNFLNGIRKGMYGEEINNQVFQDDLLYKITDIYNDKPKDKTIKYGDYTDEYEYEVDDKGFPLKKLTYRNGELAYKTEYFFE